MIRIRLSTGIGSLKMDQDRTVGFSSSPSGFQEFFSCFRGNTDLHSDSRYYWRVWGFFSFHSGFNFAEFDVAFLADIGEYGDSRNQPEPSGPTHLPWDRCRFLLQAQKGHRRCCAFFGYQLLYRTFSIHFAFVLILGIQFTNQSSIG